MLYAVAKIADGRQDCIWTLLGDIYDAYHQPYGAKNFYMKNQNKQMNKLSVPTSPIKITKMQQKKNEKAEETTAMLTSHTRSAPGSILGHINLTGGSNTYINPNSGITVGVDDMENDMLMPHNYDMTKTSGISFLVDNVTKTEVRKNQKEDDIATQSNVDVDAFVDCRNGGNQSYGEGLKQKIKQGPSSYADGVTEEKEIEERFLRIHSPTRIRERKTGINVPRSEWIGEDQHIYKDPNHIKYNLGGKQEREQTENSLLSQKYKQLLKTANPKKDKPKFSSSNSYSILIAKDYNQYTNRRSATISTKTRHPEISSKDEEEIRSWLLELGLYPPIPLSRRISSITFNDEKSLSINISKEKENINCLMNSTLGSDSNSKTPFLFHSNIYSTNKPSKHSIVADLDNDLQTYNYEHSTKITKIFPLTTREATSLSDSIDDDQSRVNITSISMSQSSSKNDFKETSTVLPYAKKHFLTDPLRNGLILSILFRTLEPDMAGQVNFEKKMHKYPIQSLKQVKENVAKTLWLFRMKKSPPIPIRFLSDVEGIVRGEYNLVWGLLKAIKNVYANVISAPEDLNNVQSQTLEDSLSRKENVSHSTTKPAKYTTTIDESVSSLGQEGVSMMKRGPNKEIYESHDKKDIFLKHLGYTLESKRKMESALIQWFHNIGLVNKDISNKLPRTLYHFFPYFQDGTLFCRIAEIVLDCTIKGWIEKPRTKDVCLRNIHKAIVCLRRSTKKISNRFLIAENIEESIYDGEVAVILGLCEDIYRFSDGLIPYSNVIPSSSNATMTKVYNDPTLSGTNYTCYQAAMPLYNKNKVGENIPYYDKEEDIVFNHFPYSGSKSPTHELPHCEIDMKQEPYHDILSRFNVAKSKASSNVESNVEQGELNDIYPHEISFSINQNNDILLSQRNRENDSIVEKGLSQLQHPQDDSGPLKTEDLLPFTWDPVVDKEKEEKQHEEEKESISDQKPSSPLSESKSVTSDASEKLFENDEVKVCSEDETLSQDIVVTSNDPIIDDSENIKNIQKSIQEKKRKEMVNSLLMFLQEYRIKLRYPSDLYMDIALEFSDGIYLSILIEKLEEIKDGWGINALERYKKILQKHIAKGEKDLFLHDLIPKATKLQNIRRFLNILRGKNKIPLRLLHSEYDILEGKTNVLIALLFHIRKAYGRTKNF